MAPCEKPLQEWFLSTAAKQNAPNLHHCYCSVEERHCSKQVFTESLQLSADTESLLRVLSSEGIKFCLRFAFCTE